MALLVVSLGSTGCLEIDPSYAQRTDVANVNYAFVSSGSYTGDLGGVLAANERCNRLANAADLPGRYVAYLSDSHTDAVDRLESANGWIRTDGQPWASDREALLDGGFHRALNLTESGEPTAALVFTGTSSDGRRTMDNCSDWTDASEHGSSTVGLSSSLDLDSWAGMQSMRCSKPMHLYCLGVDFDAPLPVD